MPQLEAKERTAKGETLGTVQRDLLASRTRFQTLGC
jgi:hypothetical protein